MSNATTLPTSYFQPGCDMSMCSAEQLADVANRLRGMSAHFASIGYHARARATRERAEMCESAVEAQRGVAPCRYVVRRTQNEMRL